MKRASQGERKVNHRSARQITVRAEEAASSQRPSRSPGWLFQQAVRGIGIPASICQLRRPKEIRMSYRVIQWGTGNVGAFSLRCIIEHPELELVGVCVHSESKSGTDAGDLCGLPPVGVHATNDADRILALEADCVCYTATADLRPFEAAQDVCRILESGKNVVSSSIVPLVHPKSFIAEVRDQLADACRRGGTSFFTSGIDPGFANDLLPLTLSGLCGSWKEVRVLEIINYATYNQPTVLFDTMGFGKPLDDTPLLLTPGTLEFAWGGTVNLLAEGLGVDLEAIRSTYEKRPAVKPIRI